jgi:predicted CoA-binding protein/mannose-6-phosphate isomerase-like protein (cupin superfamily)
MGDAVITPKISTTRGAHFTAARLGSMERLDGYELKVPQLERPIRGKVFLKRVLGLTGMEASVTSLPAGAAIPYLHRHRAHEELYVFIAGRGQMQVDGEAFEVMEGSVVRVAPGGARSVRAAAGVALRYLCIQARESSMPDGEAADDGELVRSTLEWPGEERESRPPPGSGAGGKISILGDSRGVRDMKTMPSSMGEARAFLATRRIAVVGLSRKEDDFSRLVLRELARRGYDVVPVHPAMREAEGRTCFARVQDVSPPAEAALLLTPPAVTEQVVRDCAAAGVSRVWMHRGGGAGAASEAAVAFCEAHGIAVVRDLCPFMALPDAGVGHRLHGFFRRAFGGHAKPGRFAGG